jgi:4-diphosphocytidyl-2-C-methyl-D-erythritol kinase
MVLVNPGVAVSTPDVFGALTSRENPGLPPLPLFNRPSPLPSPRDPSTSSGRGEGKGEGQLAFGDICRWLASTRNDLQSAALSIVPAIAQAIEALTFAGAGFARMSGSGATCFGLFGTSCGAARAAAQIQARQPGWWVVATESIASEDPADDAA